MSEEDDEKNKKKNETMFDKFYKNRWMWIGLLLVLTVLIELSFQSTY